MKKNLDLLKKIIFLTGRRKIKLLYLNFYFLISALIDVLSIGILIPYLGLITNSEYLYQLNFFNKNLNFLYNLELTNLIYIFSFTIIVIFLLKTIIIIWVNRKIAQYCYNIGGELRYILLNNFFNSDYLKIKNTNISNYIYQIQSLSMIYAKGTLIPFMKLVSEVFILIFIILLMSFVNINIVLVLSFIFLFFNIFYLRFFKNLIISYGKKINSYNKNIIKTINESVKGYKEIKVYNRESFFLNFIDKLSLKYTNINVNNITITKSYKYLIELSAIIITVSIVIYLNINKIDLIKNIPLLTFYVLALIRLMPSINNIIISINQIRLNTDSINLLYKDLKQIKNIDYEKVKRNNAVINNKYDEKKFDKIILNKLSYSYNKNYEVIKNLSFEINNGDFIGIKGHSGSGKSTLVEMLLGFLKLDSGKITIIKKDNVKQITSLNDFASYVPQDFIILDSTLSTNISLEENTNDINQQLYEISLEKAQIKDDFKQRFKNKAINLGNDGNLISGGQKQRIAIARSLYQNKPIIIFDETTSNLDATTQHKILEEIQSLKGIKTIIIISHDDKVISFCDRVIDLDA